MRRGEYPPYKGIDFTKPIEVCLDIGLFHSCPSWFECTYLPGENAVRTVEEKEIYGFGPGLELRNIEMRTDEEIDSELKKAINKLKKEAAEEKAKNAERLKRVLKA